MRIRDATRLRIERRRSGHAWPHRRGEGAPRRREQREAPASQPASTVADGATSWHAFRRHTNTGPEIAQCRVANALPAFHRIGSRSRRPHASRVRLRYFRRRRTRRDGPTNTRISRFRIRKWRGKMKAESAASAHCRVPNSPVYARISIKAFTDRTRGCRTSANRNR